VTEIKRAPSIRRALRAARSDSSQLKRHLIETARAPFISTATAPTAAPIPTWASRYRSRLVVTDLAVICVAVLGAFVTRFWWEQSPTDFAETAASYSAIVVLIAASWIIALAALHTRDSRDVGLGIAEYRGVVNASVLAFGLVGIAFLALDVKVARGFFLLALPIGLVGLLLNRWLWRKWLMRQRRDGNFVSRAIVVGKPADVRYVINQITTKATLVYDIVGAAIDDPDRDTISTNSRTVRVLTGLDSVAKTAAQLRVDAVIVAGQPGGGDHYIRDLGWDLEGTGAELVVASSLTNVAGPRIHFRPVEGLPLMHVELPHYEGGKHVLKRALDIVASGVAIAALMPLMVVIGILVCRDSDGPALFRQERVGKGGRTFYMLKFRSMVPSAEEALAGLLDKNEGSGVLFKLKDDPRVTRVGRVLRKYSLDELPQLWNIFIGEMSLVGPRPPLMSEVASYEDRVHRRLFIKPGLTGMWQVNGRSNLDWEESVRLDLYYVENWSLTGDLVIIWRTFKVLIHPVGAY
jgi:exopolysaccharide biosynthesis polyprenyl glycosylphosphotransferase